MFEVSKRDWLTIALVLFMPLMAFAFAPIIRPFRWSRLLWTFLLPVVLFVLWIDGVISCLRAYTPSELLELARGLSHDGYHWEVGEERKRRLPVTVTYLIGYPDSKPKQSVWRATTLLRSPSDDVTLRMARG